VTEPVDKHKTQPETEETRHQRKIREISENAELGGKPADDQDFEVQTKETYEKQTQCPLSPSLVVKKIRLQFKPLLHERGKSRGVGQEERRADCQQEPNEKEKYP
jgi:hypothetical protein